MSNNIIFTTPHWLSITWNISGFLTIISFTFGMYLVWFKSTKEMRDYKHCLSTIVFFTSLFDIVFNFIYRPIAFFPLWGGFSDGILTQILGKVLSAIGLFEGDATYFLPLIQLACYEAFISLVCGFLFRYLALKQDSWILQSIFRQYCFFTTIHISTTFPCPVFCFLARPSRSAMIEYIYEKHPEYSPIVNHTMWVIIDPEIGGGNPWASAYGYCCVVVCCLYMIIGTIANQLVLLTLRRMKAHMSERTYKLHKSLFVALCWQSAVPVCMYFVPFLTAMLIIVFRMEGNVQAWMNLCSAMMGTHSVINVILMTYFTKPYRDFARQILNRFGLLKKQTVQVVEVTNVSSQQSQ